MADMAGHQLQSGKFERGGPFEIQDGTLSLGEILLGLVRVTGAQCGLMI